MKSPYPGALESGALNQFPKSTLGALLMNEFTLNLPMKSSYPGALESGALNQFPKVHLVQY